MTQKIYLGPTMAGQGITIVNGSIFNGPASAVIEKKKEDEPSFAALFVSIADVGKARTGIRNGDTFLAQCYQSVYRDYINGKKGDNA